LASVETGIGHYPEAEKLLRQVLEVQRRVVGPEHPDTLLFLNNLGVVLDDSGRWADSEKIERELLDTERRILGPEHPDTLRTMDNLANSLSELGRYAEAEKLERETIVLRTRFSGPDHPLTTGAVYNLACILAREGRRDEAVSFLRQSLDHGLPLKTALGIESDSDLKSLLGDPRFDAIVVAARQHAATERKLPPVQTPH